MFTREDIIEFYKAGPEAVMSVIMELESINKEQETLIVQLKDRVEFLKSRIFRFLN